MLLSSDYDIVTFCGFFARVGSKRRFTDIDVSLKLLSCVSRVEVIFNRHYIATDTSPLGPQYFVVPWKETILFRALTFNNVVVPRPWVLRSKTHKQFEPFPIPCRIGNARIVDEKLLTLSLIHI